ncbi:FG-GAP and VCBS repeat-containing protein [Streptomyces sp. NPDC002671]
MRMRFTVAALCAAVATGTALAQPGAAATGTVLPGDYNNDGYPDAVIGAGLANVDGVTHAGYMTTLNGSAHGLTTSGGKLLSRASLPGDPLAGEGFGTDLGGSADLNGDGYADQVVVAQGYPHLTIVWGGKGGLSGGSRVSGTYPLTPSIAQADVGDVDGDGHADIVAPAAIAADTAAGQGLAVLRGPFNRTNGHAASAVFYPSQNKDAVQPGGVTMGDINHDGKADAVVRGYTVDADGKPTKLTVALYLGGKDGLVYAGKPLDGVYPDDIAIGDINHDGYGDIVAGTSGTDNVPGGLGGTVTVVYGGPQGMSTKLAPQKITQDTPGVPGTGEAHDSFGRSVSVGDTDGDGYADIAIGTPREAIGTGTAAIQQAGTVTIVRGGADGVTATGARLITQETAGVPGTSRSYDHFGGAVSLIDGNRDGRADLVVGAYHKNNQSGRAWVLPAAPGGITGTGSTSFDGTAFGAPAGRDWYGAAISD